MGRIKTQLIKRTTHELINKHGDKVLKTFDDNKKIVEKYTDVSSKKLRNVIAGYLTRLKKKNSLLFNK